MSDYKMTVYADPKGPTGHFSVSVSGPGLEKKGSGKYPGQVALVRAPTDFALNDLWSLIRKVKAQR